MPHRESPRRKYVFGVEKAGTKKRRAARNWGKPQPTQAPAYIRRSGAMLDFEITLETPIKHDDGDFIWFHPRAAAVPGAGEGGGIRVVMTLQKHLLVSDYYSGLYVMRTNDLGETWTGPDEVPELGWRKEAEGVTRAVCDVTPGMHAATGKLLAIGMKILYRDDGRQIRDVARSRETAYAVHDPATGEWSAWRILDMPDREPKFFRAGSGCAQWLVEPDGAVLVPVYFQVGRERRYLATVTRCSFDGATLAYVERGDELRLDVVRGLSEPSIARFRGRYYLTLRNDVKGYVTRGDDGLRYEPIRPWTFDDGAELGSYNTQQHWLTHSSGLFLTYTRRGADNDHVPRNRAPLFIAQVDPDRLCVIRGTERVLIPERGAQMGNFGAAAINERESWVTVVEGVWGEARERGSEGALFVARVKWSEPNGSA